jgi:hypothetical protein
MRLLGARRAIGLGLGQRPPDAWVLVCQGLTDHGRVCLPKTGAFVQFPYPPSPAVVSNEATLTVKERTFFRGACCGH